jgi:hypothetical protein
MKRVVILIAAAMIALCVTLLQEINIGNAQQVNTPTPTPSVVTGQAQPETGNTDSALYPPYPYTLILTLQDTGRAFTVPINSVILLSIPQTSFYEISYSPSILRLLNYDYPVPYPMPMPVDPPVMPQLPEITAVPPIQPDIAPYYGWRLMAIGYGTTNLSLHERLCFDAPCPKHPVYGFSVTITVQDIYNPPPPPPIPPIPPVPPSYGPTDVYIGTAYLNQTVKVSIGQIIALDLPFISPSERVTVVTNSNILRALLGTDLTRIQSGGWRFRVAQAGTTTITVLKGPLGAECASTSSGSCAPLFQVTITAS